jgi:hypothetical protein
MGAKGKEGKETKIEEFESSMQGFNLFPSGGLFKPHPCNYYFFISY